MGRNRLLSSCPLAKPNPECHACGKQASIIVHLNIATATVEMLAEQVLKKALSMAAPEVISAQGVVIVSAPEDEEDRQVLEAKVYPRTLQSFGVGDGTQFTVTDDLQQYKMTLTVRQREVPESDLGFDIQADLPPEQPPEASEDASSSAADQVSQLAAWRLRVFRHVSDRWRQRIRWRHSLGGCR